MSNNGGNIFIAGNSM